MNTSRTLSGADLHGGHIYGCSLTHRTSRQLTSQLSWQELTADMYLHFIAFAALLSPVTIEAALYSDPAQLPKGKAYDYIVIGSGPGGSPIAARLSEDPSVNVLIIEAGPTGFNYTNIEVPGIVPYLQPTSPFDWNYTMVPQPGLNDRSFPFSRGKVLGGCTAINWMFWVRCAQDDYDGFARVSGDDGWSWKSMLPLWNKIERLVPPLDHHNTSGEINPSIHGKNGAINISVHNAPYPTDDPVVRAAQEVGGDFRLMEDYNSGDPLGLAWFQGSIGNGIRNDAATAYLAPALSRKNLDILIKTQVTKLVQTGFQDDKPVIRGVTFAQSRTAPAFALNATKEVILAAGAFNTPQLLLLSGIGPASDLSLLGVPTIIDHPNVGQNLTDQPLVPLHYGAAQKQDDVYTNLARNATFFHESLDEWETERRGIFTNAANNHLGFFRIPANDSVFEGQPDPSAGPTAPHLEFIPVPGTFSFLGPTPLAGYYTLFAVVLLTPTSRGSVTLLSTDPFTQPVINPNFLDTAFDIAALRHGIRAAHNFSRAHAWDGFLTGRAMSWALVDVEVDADVDEFTRESAITIWHPTGTAAMARCGTPAEVGGVVDPDLRVKGVEGLRVVDASVFPFVPAGHPQAVIYAFAERAAELIKSGHRACS
ncbi:GMC oxidoreductase [Trametes coccinea BRFM310]|uniref:GMC oxidoreductase n=1 Tax=Trametes coccinea (strain BRFM310) TaxID=1353009 RepID=A0A1Y2IUK1_TRAC3|nr:GMC oxidoreductase [Trametes coccinea BRFM310]